MKEILSVFSSSDEYKAECMLFHKIDMLLSFLISAIILVLYGISYNGILVHKRFYKHTIPIN